MLCGGAWSSLLGVSGHGARALVPDQQRHQPQYGTATRPRLNKHDATRIMLHAAVDPRDHGCDRSGAQFSSFLVRTLLVCCGAPARAGRPHSA